MIKTEGDKFSAQDHFFIFALFVLMELWVCVQGENQGSSQFQLGEERAVTQSSEHHRQFERSIQVDSQRHRANEENIYSCSQCVSLLPEGDKERVIRQLLASVML